MRIKTPDGIRQNERSLMPRNTATNRTKMMKGREGERGKEKEAGTRMNGRKRERGRMGKRRNELNLKITIEK